MDAESADFARFYAESRDDCLRTVLASIGDLDRAKDLVDEAFARAWASWRKVRRHPAPRAWIVRTALNTGKSSWRRRRREVQLGETVSSVDAASGTALRLVRPGPRGRGQVPWRVPRGVLRRVRSADPQ